jgi:diguanylate cyclase (GGDEF)-like protein
MTVDIERFQPLLDLAPGGCLLVEDGVVKRSNAEAVAILGIPSRRLADQPLDEFLIPRFEPVLNEMILSATTDAERKAHRSEVRLARDLAPIELVARATGAPGLLAVGVRSMETEHHYSAQAGGSLTHDATTGLPDHLHVLTQLHQRLEGSESKGASLIGVWIDDLDGLTHTHGARAINRVMRQTGARIQQRLRAPDLVGRFDNSGFLVLLSSEATTEELSAIAERLRAEAAFPHELDRGLVSFTTSVVVGSVTSTKVSVERVLSLFESAAQRAASTGGNRTDLITI